MSELSELFPASYEASRQRFRSWLPLIQKQWGNAQLFSPVIDETDDLTLDYIEAPASQKKEKVVFFTIGEHGIEAYVGSAMQKLFIDEFVPTLDPTNTSLILVHAINAWGMKHFRRVNGNNVDPNRNFVISRSDLDPVINPAYSQVDGFLNPKREPRSWLQLKAYFLGGLVKSMVTLGVNSLRTATLLGQYRFQNGLYYGGTDFQPEVAIVQALYKHALEEHERFLLLDMHTGYGPRYSMAVVNSALEPRSSEELAKAFKYSNVVKTDPSEFYSIQGDMIDYVYKLADGKKDIYATTFEFGTFGDSFTATLRSLRAMIFENWLAHVESKSVKLKRQVKQEFGELYFPVDIGWREKALKDARQAFAGILNTEKYT
jgi:hypothetical protein